MRRILLVIALSVIASILSLAQQNSLQQSEIDALLVQLRSNDAGDRDHAYERLKTDPSALRSPKVKAALLDLLDREARRMSGAPRQGDGEDDVGTEGFAEYYSDLAGTVGDIGDWDDPNQVCILVRGAGVPPSNSPAEAALREKLAWPCLKEMAGSRRVLDRVSASLILIELSARAGGALDSAIAQEKKQIIVHALHDEDESVRGETINCLGRFGTEDIIPALKQVAESDPAVNARGFWMRKWADKAIAAIQQRAGKH